MLEKDIESTVCRYAKQKYNFLVYKFTSPNRRSVPDRLFFGHGDHYFLIEFKSPLGQLTPGQTREIKKLTDRGIRVYVVNSIELGKQVMDYEAAQYAQGIPAKGHRLFDASRPVNAVVGHGSRKNSG